MANGKMYETFGQYCMYYLLPLALESGMNAEDFWYDDEYVVYAMIQAYQNRINTTAWLNSAYIRYALFDALNAAFGGKKQSIFPSKPFALGEVEEKTQNIPLESEENFRKVNSSWF